MTDNTMNLHHDVITKNYHHDYSGFILLSSQCSGATLLVLNETISLCSLHGLLPTSVQ